MERCDDGVQIVDVHVGPDSPGHLRPVQQDSQRGPQVGDRSGHGRVEIAAACTQPVREGVAGRAALGQRQQEPEERPDRIRRRPQLDRLGRQPDNQIRHRGVDQRGLAREVPVHRPRPDPGPPGDLVQRDPDTLGVERGGRGVEDPPAVDDSVGARRPCYRRRNGASAPLSCCHITDCTTAREPAVPLSTEDRLAIHELIALHGHLADDRRPEDLGLLLSPDAVYDVEDYGLGTVTGLPAIQALFAERPGQQPLGHHVTNIVLTEQLDGTVRARSKGLAVMAGGGAGTVGYDDALVRTAAGWRITRRKVVKPRTD